MTVTGDEIEMLRLPCGHLKPRPTKLTSTVVCRCGSTWRLERRAGEWCARLTHRDTIEAEAVP